MGELKFPEGAKVSTYDDPRRLPREEWGDGPWKNEPDRVEWRIAALPGLVLLAVRGPSGGWCGYVGVPPEHPAHGKDYGAVDVSVHGGLTFSDRCQTGEHAQICHVPAPGEADEVWWLGFDCAHGCDYSPAHEATFRKHSAHLPPEYRHDFTRAYRDFDYVKGETESLAEQLAAMVVRQ